MENQRYLPTGNEWVSIPTLFTDGSIENINVLSMKYRGLLELCGSEDQPLLQPFVKLADERIKWNLTWEREDHWVPIFTGKSDSLLFKGEVVTPIGERGFYYHLSLVNESKEIKHVDWGMDGNWLNTLHTINESKVMNARKSVVESGWNESILFELSNEAPFLSLAPMTSTNLDDIDYTYDEQTDQIHFCLSQSCKIKPGEKKELSFFWGVGLEEVGAATSSKEMQRKGTETLKDELKSWLQKRALTTEDPKLDEVMNLNLFFNYFYATGQTLDTEEDVLVTSRSPRYYVSAAYWDRDSLLWSFPSILITDRKRARSMLDYVFTKQRRNIGVHSRYIDGVVLEPGFELDELCAPIIALDMYVKETGDRDYLRHPHVQDTVIEIIEKIEDHKHAQLDLYDTFLQPTDDPIVYPYLTYNNVLVWKVMHIVASFAEQLLVPLQSDKLAKQADEIKKAIYDQTVFEEETGTCFAWSVDLRGNHNVYDEPPGSLQLIAYYGFCSFDDPIYQNTVRLIRSDRYSYAFKGKPFEELGCAHANHPWVLSIANSFLSGRVEQARDLVMRTSMDGGIACESIDEYTGLPRTGEHFATCAGFLAYAIYHAYGKGEKQKWTQQSDTQPLG
ncbi:glycoside hydrolase family 125 protein [Alkalihalobacillus sp. AL-G]|uniref:glycoside hydrolase family 125 protein n=1 Tax=Alkalihalobacillus sp. AL-G TaxID=2926399 RepID=UPI00272A8735|nr:glycoside hydrolase family 125 protein [Alkalihalobacillus sp. AL-G]WLD92599.1 glycoside hydrolase family 125 protein [Alkalihalobacillus sp. AL-G]